MSKRKRDEVERIQVGERAQLVKFRLPRDSLVQLHSDLKDARPAEKDSFSFMGRMVQHPRRHRAYFKDYRFSGKKHAAAPAEETPESLRAAINAVNAALNASLGEGEKEYAFNSALVNWYGNGYDYIAKHSDDERGLAEPARVATLSLGQVRTLRVRNKSDNEIVCDVQTLYGLVYVMSGSRFQSHYTHEVPKVAGRKGEALGERISVTLREHVVRDEQ